MQDLSPTTKTGGTMDSSSHAITSPALGRNCTCIIHPYIESFEVGADGVPSKTGTCPECEREYNQEEPIVREYQHEPDSRLEDLGNPDADATILYELDDDRSVVEGEHRIINISSGPKQSLPGDDSSLFSHPGTTSKIRQPEQKETTESASYSTLENPEALKEMEMQIRSLHNEIEAQQKELAEKDARFAMLQAERLNAHNNQLQEIKSDNLGNNTSSTNSREMYIEELNVQVTFDLTVSDSSFDARAVQAAIKEATKAALNDELSKARAVCGVRNTDTMITKTISVSESRSEPERAPEIISSSSSTLSSSKSTMPNTFSPTNDGQARVNTLKTTSVVTPTSPMTTTVTNATNTSHLSIEVKSADLSQDSVDNGTPVPGVASRYREIIFEPFGDLNNSAEENDGEKSNDMFEEREDISWPQPLSVDTTTLVRNVSVQQPIVPPPFCDDEKCVPPPVQEENEEIPWKPFTEEHTSIQSGSAKVSFGSPPPFHDDERDIPPSARREEVNNDIPWKPFTEEHTSIQSGSAKVSFGSPPPFHDDERDIPPSARREEVNNDIPWKPFTEEHTSVQSGSAKVSFGSPPPFHDDARDIPPSARREEVNNEIPWKPFTEEHTSIQSGSAKVSFGSPPPFHDDARDIPPSARREEVNNEIPWKPFTEEHMSIQSGSAKDSFGSPPPFHDDTRDIPPPSGRRQDMNEEIPWKPFTEEHTSIQSGSAKVSFGSPPPFHDDTRDIPPPSGRRQDMNEEIPWKPFSEEHSSMQNGSTKRSVGSPPPFHDDDERGIPPARRQEENKEGTLSTKNTSIQKESVSQLNAPAPPSYPDDEDNQKIRMKGKRKKKTLSSSTPSPFGKALRLFSKKSDRDLLSAENKIADSPSPPTPTPPPPPPDVSDPRKLITISVTTNEVPDDETLTVFTGIDHENIGSSTRDIDGRSAIETVTSVKLFDRNGDRGTYTGKAKRKTGLPHGVGRMIYETKGEIYDGEWTDGRWNGYGQTTHANGDSYQGAYRNFQRQGRGTFRWHDGRTYDGEYNEDERSGQGVYHWPDGSYYKGTFRNGQRHGHGEHRFVDGTIYKGNFANGLYDGFGVCEWEDGRTYLGEWKAGVPHGQGVEGNPDGSIRHDGEWYYDRPVVQRK